MISKLLALENQAYKLYNVYVTAVTIRLESVNVTIINIYNPIGNKEVIIIGKFIKLALDKIKKDIILLKDFNIHHPIQGGRAAAIKTQSEYFLKETERRTLYLLIPQGEAIQ